MIMVSCRMNIIGLYTVLCLMTIYVVDVAECGEYVIVFEEVTCPRKYTLTPLTADQIKWDSLHPCNSTDKDLLRKKRLVEFDCLGKQRDCRKHVVRTNFQNHSFIMENHSAKLIVSTTEAVTVPTTTKAVVAATTTEALVAVTTTETAFVPTTTEHHTTTPIVSTTAAIHVPTSNITKEKTRHTVYDEYNPITYDVNIIYINENNVQNSSKKANEKSKRRNKIFQCEYAEIVCENDGNPKNYSLSEVKNVTKDTPHYELPEALQIEINRDESSAVQPLFTGYFSESSNDSTTNYNDNFKDHKVMNTSCSIKKGSNCKQNIDSLKHINVYLKTNYIENNTITMYPNCTKDSITSKNELIVKCEDMSFAKHNQHILQAPPKKELWYCQITESKNNHPSTEQRSENRKIHFGNCSNKTKLIDYKNKSKAINVGPISDHNNGTGLKISGKEVVNINISSEINPENILTIHITEQPKNCSQKSYFNINEGKIIDLGLENKKEKILPNNDVELKLSECINDKPSMINDSQTDSMVDLTIILKSEALNASDLEQFNGTLKDGSVKQIILLRCDQTSNNATSNMTVLQCESMDLDLYNITGIEISENLTLLSNVNNSKEMKQEHPSNDEVTDRTNKSSVEVNNTSNFSKNQTVENTESTVINKTNENKEVQKNITENNNINKTKDESKNNQTSHSKNKDDLRNKIFNRRKDIPEGTGQNNLALKGPETEKILLIALVSIAGAAILLVIVLRTCTKKNDYNVAPTREPPDEEETAF